MPTNGQSKIRCYAMIPFDKEFHPLKDAIKSVCKAVGARLTLPEEIAPRPTQIAQAIYSEILRSDLLFADVSRNNKNVFYEIGLGHALGKPILLLNQQGQNNVMPSLLQGYPLLIYDTTLKGLVGFQKLLHKVLEDFVQAPHRFSSFSLSTTKIARPPYIIDLEKLGPREFENLCFELFAQMGFRRVEWGKELREIDVVATLPKKDPDGYEYQELWLIAMGRHAPIEKMMEMAIRDPDFFLHSLLRYEALEELFSRQKIRSDVPITILLIFRREGPPPEFYEHELKKIEKRLQGRPFTVRVRWWDSSYLTNLIQQYPQIAFKYFSEESRAKSRYRKTPEELNQENVRLTENLLVAKNKLDQEKRKRFIAERNAAWKDVAFKAAHKLGNPVDATDTFLQGLKKRIQNNHPNIELLKIANEMDVSLEEAKKVIEQFKSLVKAQEIAPHSANILPLIEQACKTAEENGVNVSIQPIKKCPQVMIDPDRISECFNELVANSLHWFDKAENKIVINVNKPLRRTLPETLRKTQGYLKIHYEDNGCGVPLENKEKIFAPFFTTYPHGTGLGLSLVKTIIEGHGGQITENGKPGERTSFEMYLPIAKKTRKK
jgi:signal transduction histidine kinase